MVQHKIRVVLGSIYRSLFSVRIIWCDLTALTIPFKYFSNYNFLNESCIFFFHVKKNHFIMNNAEKIKC